MSMKGRIIFGILFKYAPLLSVYCFFCWFFCFPLSFFFIFPFSYLDLEPCSWHSGSRRFFLNTTYYKGQDSIMCVPGQARMTEWLSQPHQGMMVNWTTLIFSFLLFFHFLPPILMPLPLKLI